MGTQPLTTEEYLSKELSKAYEVQPWKEKLEELKSVIDALNADPKLGAELCKNINLIDIDYEDLESLEPLVSRRSRAVTDTQFHLESCLEPILLDPRLRGGPQEPMITLGLFDVSFGRVCFTRQTLQENMSVRTKKGGTTVKPTGEYECVENKREETFFKLQFTYDTKGNFAVKNPGKHDPIESPKKYFLEYLKKKFGEAVYNRVIAPRVNGDGVRTNSTPTAAGLAL